MEQSGWIARLCKGYPLASLQLVMALCENSKIKERVQLAKHLEKAVQRTNLQKQNHVIVELCYRAPLSSHQYANVDLPKHDSDSNSPLSYFKDKDLH